MEISTTVPQYRAGNRKNIVLPEVEAFLHLLVVIKLIDNSEIEKVLFKSLFHELCFRSMSESTCSLVLLSCTNFLG